MLGATEGKGESGYVELLYKEYERIGASSERLVKSSFDDFRLFGSIAGFLSWKPIVETLVLKGGITPEERPFLIFVGFVFFLLLFHVISFRDLIKQSMIYFRALELEEYESAIRTKSGLATTSDARLFWGAADWQSWLHKCHLPVFAMFVVVVSIPVIVLPTVLLLRWLPATPYWRYYLGTALGLLVWYSLGLQRILKQRDRYKDNARVAREKLAPDGLTSREPPSARSA
jgi:hypothetical protein